jgi:hypothetical protein
MIFFISFNILSLTVIYKNSPTNKARGALFKAAWHNYFSGQATWFTERQLSQGNPMAVVRAGSEKPLTLHAIVTGVNQPGSMADENHAV